VIRTLIIRQPIAEPLDALCARARACGASALGLALAPPDAQHQDISLDEARRIREALSGLESGISTVVASLTPQAHFGHSEASARNQAMGHVLAALERTAWLGARVLVLDAPAIVAADCTYAAALNGIHAALQRLRLAAQRFGVELAIAAPQPRFLLSPVELRNLLDQQQDSHTTAALNVPACQQIGFPEDWIHCLGWRIGCILLHHAELKPEVPSPVPPTGIVDALQGAALSCPLCSVSPVILESFARA